jgi:hypothetical protein
MSCAASTALPAALSSAPPQQSQPRPAPPIAEIDQRRDGIAYRLRRAAFIKRAREPYHCRIDMDHVAACVLLLATIALVSPSAIAKADLVPGAALTQKLSVALAATAGRRIQ